MKQGGGEYLMKMSLGTPPIEVVGIVDTGSDLIWTQCLPCTSCYNQTIPLFDPTNSSSYKSIPCGSTSCGELAKPICNEVDFTCEYNFSYGDGSHSIGNLASETLTLGGTNINNNSIMSLPNVLFGCGHDTGGTFDSSGSGIIGLGSGNLSLISQLGNQKNHLFSFGSKAFSYCLVPSSINSTSKISFGNDAVVSGDGIVTTPIVTKTPETFYYLTLEGISVGTERFAFAYPNNNVHDVGVVEGNIIIDSGTTLTLVPEQIFNDLVLGLDRVIRLEKVRDPNGLLSVCYKSNVGDNVKLPIITVHFKGGDVRLKPVNTFSWVNDDVFCFTMIASGDYAIYGNLAQTNFLVGFDLDAGTVSFKPTECIKEYLS